MKAALLAWLLLWQLGPAPHTAGVADPQHLRYQRALELPRSAAGQACVVLDAAVFAHSASVSINDLRLFATRPATPPARTPPDTPTDTPTDTPFALTESGPPSPDVQPAAVHDASVHDGRLDFDLSMPPRPYTEVDLQLAAKDFLALAEVWGLDPARNIKAPLGRYTLFDLSSRGLARSTALPLGETSFPDLHIELRLSTLDRQPLTDLSPALITGASVPPSRTAQTLYTTVSTISGLDNQGQWSLATATVPPHVPIERVRFVPDPSFTGDFLRDVTVAATPIAQGTVAIGVAESVPGQIFRVDLRPPAGMPAIAAQHLFVDAPLGSNLRSSAKVMASIHNGSDPPLPIQQIDLQMRERRLCFDATPNTTYTLRYGDPALPPPASTYARTFVPAASPTLATLGPERLNPRFTPRSAPPPDTSSRNDAPWLILIAAIVISGVIALQRMRREENRAP